MFQYAVARHLAYRHLTELRLDTSWYANLTPEITPRTFDLHPFNICATLASADDLIGTDGVRNAKPRDLPVALWRKVRPRFRFFAERSLRFDANVLNLPDNVCLFGFWPSEKYFIDIEAVIRQEFTLREPPDEENKRLIGVMEATPSVSLHVRRGDYVLNTEINRIHGTCSLEYYAAAIGYVAARVPGARFFVFSDDLDWVRQNLLPRHPAECVAHNRGRRDHEDLRLMSHCRHHIIANSSFSWWGAWLNPRPDKIVCAPARWFAEPSYEEGDIVPSSWVKL